MIVELKLLVNFIIWQKHGSILAAAKHDYEKFYDEEIVMRKELLFPPFINLTKVTVRARNDAFAAQTAGELAEAIRREDGNIMLSGPSPAPIARMRGYYRYNIMLKNKDRLAICGLLKKVLGSFRKPHGILIAVDVDPVSM